MATTPETAVTYRAVLAVPGTRRNLLAGILMRLSGGIIPFGTVVALAGDSGFGYAGTGSAVFVLANALTAPHRGRLVDRHGRSVLTVTALGYGIILTAAALLTGHAPASVVVALLCLAGIVTPPVAATLRSRWSSLMPDRPHLQRAHSLDSTIEELTFVAAPAIAAALITIFSPAGCLLTGGWLPLAGAAVLPSWIAGDASGVTTNTAHSDAPKTSARSRSLILTSLGQSIVLPITALGLVGGSLGVILPAARAHSGHITDAGYILALFSAGGVASGLIYGRLRPAWSTRTQYVALTAGLALSTAAIAALIRTPLLPVAVLAAGAVITPLFVLGYLLVDQHLSHRQTEANAWLASGYNLGSAASAAATGALLTRTGPHVITLLIAATAGITAAAALKIPKAGSPAESSA